MHSFISTLSWNLMRVSRMWHCWSWIACCSRESSDWRHIDYMWLVRGRRWDIGSLPHTAATQRHDAHHAPHDRLTTFAIKLSDISESNSTRWLCGTLSLYLQAFGGMRDVVVGPVGKRRWYPNTWHCDPVACSRRHWIAETVATVTQYK